MEWDPQTLEILSQSLVDTLSPEPAPRHLALNYSLAILRLIAEPSIDDHIRQNAAVNLKNHLKTNRVPSCEKKQINTLILPLILSSTPKIQAHLTQALALIGDHDDDDHHLPTLLPEINSSLQKAINGNDFASVIGILSGLNSLIKSEGPVQLHLKYFAATLLSTVEIISGKINTFGGSAEILRQLIEAQRLCFTIFYSLNLLDLPEDTADKWMNEFKNHLTVRYPVIEEDIGDSVVIGLRAVVCEIIARYMEKEEQVVLLQKYLKGFVEAAVCVVASASSPSCQRLTETAIKFLTIVSTSVHHASFSGDEILHQITQSVVPNVMLRDEDEELFEKNYVEFIRKEMEEGDLNTRRRIVCALLKGISVNYKEKITESVSILIRDCLTLFAENPAANWKYKHCAIYLVVSLSTISTDLVDVESFFTSVIAPELQGQDVNVSPMLKAGALKFFTMFRVLIPKPIAMTLLGDVARFLSSDVNVVHSYAAICIEKLLLVKDNINGQSQLRYTSVDIGLVFPVLMTNLFGALRKPGSKSNKYIMRCIMRVLQVADISSSEAASLCFTGLTNVLYRVCRIPERQKSRVFNHCLFEAVATLGTRVCKKNPSFLPAFEKCLESNIRWIMCRDIKEFVPYAFQLFAQLVILKDCRDPPPRSMWIYDMQFTPYAWECSANANVPSLIRYFQSLLQHGPPDVINTEVELASALDIVNYLMSLSPATEKHAFRLLDLIVEHIRYDILGKCKDAIWDSVYTHLQYSKTANIAAMHVIVLLSVFVVQHGTRKLEDLLDSKEGSSFHAVLGQFWIPNLKTITGYTEAKLSAVASTKIICERQSLIDPSAGELWGKMLDGVVTLLLLLSPTQPPPHEEEPETGYPSLRYAGIKDEWDPLKEIEDPKQFSVALLANLSCRYRGRFPPIIATYLSPPNQAAILHLCISYNLSIV